MSTESKEPSYAIRLVTILQKLNNGDKLQPKALAKELGVDLRTIQRYLSDQFSFLKLERVDGYYQMQSHLLGKLTSRDVERFASLAGVRGMFPWLNDEFLREMLDTQLQSALLVKGPPIEELTVSQQILFGQLENAIRNHQHIAYTYAKADGTKSRQGMEPYKLVNDGGIWYLAAKDQGQLKAYTVVKIDRLQIAPTTFTPDPTVTDTLRKWDGIWLNEKKQEVVLQITGLAAEHFRRRKLVANQVVVKELEDGGMLVSAKVVHPNQILPTVRQWIPCIRIISPEGLQAEMEAEIKGYLNG